MWQALHLRPYINFPSHGDTLIWKLKGRGGRLKLQEEQGSTQTASGVRVCVMLLSFGRARTAMLFSCNTSSHTSLRANHDLPLRRNEADILRRCPPFQISLPGKTNLHESTYFTYFLCLSCRAAESRSGDGERGRPVAVGRFSHHVRRRTSVWGKDTHVHYVHNQKHDRNLKTNPAGIYELSCLFIQIYFLWTVCMPIKYVSFGQILLKIMFYIVLYLHKRKLREISIFGHKCFDCMVIF